jgi:hypothetical protein
VILLSNVFPIDYGSGSGSISSSTSTSTVKLLRTHAIDFDAGEFLVDANGKFSIVEGLEAVKVRCWLALNMQRNRWFLFKNTGNNLKRLIGMSYNYVSLNIQNVLEEALVDGTYVTGISDIVITQTDDNFNVEFTVVSIYGTYEDETTI